MGKYNSYARKLNEAFKTAAREYEKVFTAMQAAEKAKAAAYQWKEGETREEKRLRQMQGEVRYSEAKKAFDETAPHIWERFNQTRNDLKSALAKEVFDSGLANPDAVDVNGLELLKSGVMSVDDFYSFAERYDTNPTMLKLVARYAQEAAGEAESTRDRAVLNKLVEDCRDGLGRTMREWENLSSVADFCSGQKGLGGGEPALIVSGGRRWEELTAGAVDGF